MGKAATKTADESPGSQFNGLITMSGRELQLRTAPERLVRQIQQQLGVEDGVAQTLAKRGFNPENAHDFMNLSLQRQLPDPMSFLDMKKAVDRMVKAIKADEQVAVFGDYDADGATSSAVLVRYLRAIGHTARIYIPDRFDEGYGPNTPAMLKLADEGATLCVTVDCGTAAHAPLEAAHKAGMDVVVLDHHSPKAALPVAHAVVNPKRLDESSPHTMLAAVGMTFMFVVGLNRVLREEGFFKNPQDPNDQRPAEPYLKGLLPIVALGSVTDCVPLTGASRLLVHYGLEEMNNPQSPEIAGIAALRDVCGLSRTELAQKGRKLNSEDIAFFLGPRLNAAGRIDRARTSAELLTMNDIVAAQQHARATDNINAERQAIEANIVALGRPMAEEQVAKNLPVLVVHHQEFNPGVIGIAAGRYKEEFDRPAIVIGSHNGVWKGSGRSVKGVDLGAAVIAAEDAGLIIKGGGHPMAAGLSIDPDKIEAFHQFLIDRIGPQMAKLPPRPILHIDAVVSPGSITTDFIAQQDRLAPFGQDNPRPLYLMPNARLTFAALAGDKHVRCTFTGLDGRSINGIAFRSVEQDYGKALLAGQDQLFHVVGTADLNHFNGRTQPQFKVLDIAKVTP